MAARRPADGRGGLTLRGCAVTAEDQLAMAAAIQRRLRRTADHSLSYNLIDGCVFVQFIRAYLDGRCGRTCAQALPRQGGVASIGRRSAMTLMNSGSS